MLLRGYLKYHPTANIPNCPWQEPAISFVPALSILLYYLLSLPSVFYSTHSWSVGGTLPDVCNVSCCEAVWAPCMATLLWYIFISLDSSGILRPWWKETVKYNMMKAPPSYTFHFSFRGTEVRNYKDITQIPLYFSLDKFTWQPDCVWSPAGSSWALKLHCNFQLDLLHE